MLAAGYAIAIDRLGPRLGARRARSSPGSRSSCFVARRRSRCWLASDWPIHDVAERYNYSVHMVQHLMFSMVAAPLLLLGTPAWLAALAARARRRSCAPCARSPGSSPR